jgi:hypothetical protein
MRAASTQIVGAAVCPSRCTLLIRGAIKPKGHRGKASRTRERTVRAAAAGSLPRIRIDAPLRRRIQRAGGATATLAIRLVDAAGVTRRVTTKLRLLPR